MGVLIGIGVFIVFVFIAIFGSAAAVCNAHDKRQSKKTAAALEEILRNSKR